MDVHREKILALVVEKYLEYSVKFILSTIKTKIMPFFQVIHLFHKIDMWKTMWISHYSVDNVDKFIKCDFNEVSLNANLFTMALMNISIDLNALSSL
jgi:hypothetical protein